MLLAPPHGRCALPLSSALVSSWTGRSMRRDLWLLSFLFYLFFLSLLNDRWVLILLFDVSRKKKEFDSWFNAMKFQILGGDIGSRSSRRLQLARQAHSKCTGSWRTKTLCGPRIIRMRRRGKYQCTRPTTERICGTLQQLYLLLPRLFRPTREGNNNDNTSMQQQYLQQQKQKPTAFDSSVAVFHAFPVVEPQWEADG